MPAEPAPPVPPPPGPAAPAPRPRRRRRGRAPGLLALLAGSVLVVALFFYPPAWHAGLRALLTGEAGRHGLRLEIGAVEGGPFDGLVLRDLRLRDGEADPRINLRARRAELALTPPALPFFRPPKPSWLERLTLEGLEGELRLDAPAAPADAPPPTTTPGRPAPLPAAGSWRAWVGERRRWLTRPLFARLVPSSFVLLNRPEETFTLSRGAKASLRVRGLQVTGEPDGAAGRFVVREIEARGPGGLANRYEGRHGSTLWREARLTVRDVALAPGVDLARATLDGARLLQRRRLDGDVAVRALGGELRGQFSAGLTRGQRLQLEIAGSLNAVAVRPLAGLLGIAEPTGGTVRGGQFSFRGDPEALADATGSLRAEALDFQFGERRWERLVVAATVLNHRITMHELELVQSRNRLSLNGECPLPPAPDSPPSPDWWQEKFSCQVDARLDDLHAFGQLLGPGFPELTGRMNVRGALANPGGERGIEGALEVEGSALTVRRAPLDGLRATLRFRNGELETDNLQAARAGDTLTGKGSCRLAGSFRYAAELKAHVKDLAPYHPAFAGAFFPAPPAGALTLDWSGDGGAQSHNGAFRARLGGFLAKGGRAALPRPVDLDAQGTYSPESVSFRRLLLKDSANPDAEFHLRFENGALPVTQNFAALAAGHFFLPEGALSGRLELRDFALDLLPPLLPAALAPGTDGRLAGWLDLAGTAREPRMTGALQLRKARLRWTSPRLAPSLDADTLAADFRLDGAALLLDSGAGERPAGGGTFALSGRLDWTDTASPAVLGLAWEGKNLALLDDENVRARADFNGTVRGAPAAPEIAGELRLREGGRFWRRLEFAPAVDDSPMLLARLLPLPALAAGPLADATLDLRVTAAGPLRMEGSADARGELLPELQLTGSGQRPALSGVVAVRRAPVFLPAAELETEIGALHFSADRSNDPALSITAVKTFPAERRNASAARLRADFFGPASEGNVVFSAEGSRWPAEALADFLLLGRPLTAGSPLAGAGESRATDLSSLQLPAPAPEPGTATAPAQKLYLRLR